MSYDNKALTAVSVALLFALPMLRVGHFQSPMFWDDISIVFVYAMNFLETGSFFYNVPEDRIDGFTSMMDVFFVMPFALIDADEMFRLNYYAKALLASLIPVAVFFALKSWRVAFIPALIISGVIAASEVVAHGFAMQLEAPYYALLIVAFTVLLTGHQTHRTLLLWLTAVALCLTRPEALALVFTGFGAFLLFSDQSGSKARGETWRAALATAATMLAFYGWRIWYFGFWAPNTYYAKHSGTRMEEISQGLAFLFDYLSSVPDAFIVAAFAVSAILVATRLFGRSGMNSAQERTLVIASLAAVMLAVRIVTGGDSYTLSSRLLIDVTLLSALTAGAATVIAGRFSYATLLTLSVLGVAGNLAIIIGNMPANLNAGFIRHERFSDALHDCERDTIRSVYAANPGMTLAQTDFQRAKFYVPQMTVFDLSGLNNRDIAHRPGAEDNLFGKHDLQYGLDNNADVWKLGTGVRELKPITQEQWDATLESGFDPEGRRKTPNPFFLNNAERLAAEYEPTAAPSCGNYMNLIVRKGMIIPKGT